MPDGSRIEIATTIRDRDTGEILHVPAEGSAVALRAGDAVTASIDWDLRHAHMRCHTCLHLLCALIPFPVTGGSVRAGTGRLDFDIPQPILDKDELTAKLNELIARNAPLSFQFISEEELRARPELVRTLEGSPRAQREGPPGAHRRYRSPAVRREPPARHRRDRPGADREDGEEGPAKPARRDRHRGRLSATGVPGQCAAASAAPAWVEAVSQAPERLRWLAVAPEWEAFVALRAVAQAPHAEVRAGEMPRRSRRTASQWPGSPPASCLLHPP